MSDLPPQGVKGGPGKGKGNKLPTKRGKHKKKLADNINGVTKPAIRRLARRGGVRRISGMMYEETRTNLKRFLTDIVQDAITYADHSKRRTITPTDVVLACKRKGKTLYGYHE